MNKPEIRDTFIERRRDLLANAVGLKSSRIAERLEVAVDWPSVTSLHVYTSVESWNEVNTEYGIRRVKESFPSIAITKGDANRSVPLPQAQFDVILVPLLAFDAQLNRLGFGGGWYDRFLEQQPGALKVGLAFDIQYSADSLPTKWHDIPMDVIVTESTTYKTS